MASADELFALVLHIRPPDPLPPPGAVELRGARCDRPPVAVLKASQVWLDPPGLRESMAQQPRRWSWHALGPGDAARRVLRGQPPPGIPPDARDDCPLEDAASCVLSVPLCCVSGNRSALFAEAADVRLLPVGPWDSLEPAAPAPDPPPRRGRKRRR